MRYSRQLRKVSEDYPEAIRQLLEQIITIQEESERYITELEKKVKALEEA